MALMFLTVSVITWATYVDIMQSHKFALFFVFFPLVLRFVPHDALRHVSHPSKRLPGVLFYKSLLSN
jgi:hypothetical protein